MGDEEIQVIKTKLTYQTWKKMKEKEREREEVQIIKTVRKRTIFLDGQNIAFAKTKCFKAERIRTVASYFLKRHHKVVLMIPESRKWKLKKEGNWDEVAILVDMEKDPHIEFMYTPSFQREGRSWDCYDDSFILKASTIEEGIVVSNDKFRDIYKKTTDEQMKIQIKERSLPFRFYQGNLLLPDDPCGREGLRLEEFLCF